MALRDPRARSGNPRQPDPSGSRSHGDPTDMAVHVYRQVSREQLIPQIANRTRNAISIDGRQIFLYQRLHSGRRCSCFKGVNSTPSSDCPICLNTGFAGGYLKWGTDLYLFDPSRQWYGVNTLVNPLIGSPPWFSLEEGHVSGYVEWAEKMEMGTYFGLDAYRFEYRKQGGSVTLQMKLEGSDPTFVPFTEDAFKQRLLLANGGTFKFRVTLRRAVTSDTSPLFQFFFFRALIRSPDAPILIVDIPRRNESNGLVDLIGAENLFQEINMVFSDEVKKVSLEDVVVRLFDMTRWKVNETSPNDPMNLLTSWDVNLRKVQPDEGMARITL